MPTTPNSEGLRGPAARALIEMLDEGARQAFPTKASQLTALLGPSARVPLDRVPDQMRYDLGILVIAHLGSSSDEAVSPVAAEGMRSLFAHANGWFHAIRQATSPAPAREAVWCSAAGFDAWIPAVIAGRLRDLVPPEQCQVTSDRRWILDPAWPVPIRQARMMLAAAQDIPAYSQDLRPVVIASSFPELMVKIAPWAMWWTGSGCRVTDILQAGPADLLAVAAGLLHRGVRPLDGFQSAAALLGIPVRAGMGYTEEVLQRSRVLYQRPVPTARVPAPRWRCWPFETIGE